jgi:hypothetical protein
MAAAFRGGACCETAARRLKHRARSGLPLAGQAVAHLRDGRRGDHLDRLQRGVADVLEQPLARAEEGAHAAAEPAEDLGVGLAPVAVGRERPLVQPAAALAERVLEALAGPATNPSSETESWQVTLIVMPPCTP